MTRYWYAPRMMYPWWCSYPDERGGETCWHNAEADTDMGDLWGDEFHEMFPNAYEISEKEYNDMTLYPDGKQ